MPEARLLISPFKIKGHRCILLSMLVTLLGSGARIMIYRAVADLQAVHASSGGISLVPTGGLLNCTNSRQGWPCCLVFHRSWGHTCQRMAPLSPSCPPEEQLAVCERLKPPVDTQKTTQAAWPERSYQERQLKSFPNSCSSASAHLGAPSRGRPVLKKNNGFPAQAGGGFDFLSSATGSCLPPPRSALLAGPGDSVLRKAGERRCFLAVTDGSSKTQL